MSVYEASNAEFLIKHCEISWSTYCWHSWCKSVERESAFIRFRYLTAEVNDWEDWTCNCIACTVRQKPLGTTICNRSKEIITMVCDGLSKTRSSKMISYKCHTMNSAEVWVRAIREKMYSECLAVSKHQHSSTHKLQKVFCLSILSLKRLTVYLWRGERGLWGIDFSRMKIRLNKWLTEITQIPRKKKCGWWFKSMVCCDRRKAKNIQHRENIQRTSLQKYI